MSALAILTDDLPIRPRLSAEGSRFIPRVVVAVNGLAVAESVAAAIAAVSDALDGLRFGIVGNADQTHNTLEKLAALIEANRTTLATVMGGSRAELDTFVEVYSRFLADETVAAALNTAVANLGMAISGIQTTLAQKLDTAGDGSNLTIRAVGSANVRKSSDRANDFVMLADDMSSSVTVLQAVAMAKDRLKAKGGGRLRYPRGGLDCGTEVYVESENRIVHEGETSTILYSARPDAPLMLFKSTAGTNRSGMAGIQVASTVARSTPLVQVVNGYGSNLKEVEAVTAGACPAAFDIDGGPNCYNVKLSGVRCFGPFGSLVRVGLTAQVQNFTLTDNWQAGDTTNAAILLFDVSGMTLGAGEALACMRGFAAQPGPGQSVLCVQIGTGVLFDSSIMEGFYAADAGGYIETITSLGLWCCSSGGNRGAAAKYPNVFIAASAAGHIRRIDFASATTGNSSSHGVVVLTVDGVSFTDSHSDGNGANGTGDGYFIGNGARNVALKGGSARGAFTQRAPFAPFQRYAVNIDVDTDGISVLDRLNASGNLAGTVTSFSNGTNNSIQSGSGFYG